MKHDAHSAFTANRSEHQPTKPKMQYNASRYVVLTVLFYSLSSALVVVCWLRDVMGLILLR